VPAQALSVLGHVGPRQQDDPDSWMNAAKLEVRNAHGSRNAAKPAPPRQAGQVVERDSWLWSLQP
jgi:hypothetical protein